MPGPELVALANDLKDLEQLISMSLGPLGADKIVETDAKVLLVTNNGLDLMQVLSPNTAMLLMVVKSIKSFANSHGDGSKRLVILMSRGLQEVMHYAHGQSLIPLIRGLSALQTSYLDQLAEKVAANMQLLLSVPAQEGNMDASLRKVIDALLTTHMVNKVGCRAVQHLAALLSELVCKRLQHAGPGSSAWDVVHQLESQLPVCLVPGGLVTGSRLVQGVILRQPLTSPHMHQTIERCSKIRFMLLSCSVDAADGHASGSGMGGSAAPQPCVEVRSEQALRAAAHAHQRAVRQRLERLRGRGVNLLLSTQPASSLLSFLCVEAGLALVAGVEEEDARSIASSAGVLLADSAGEAALQSAGVGEALSCYRLPLGSNSSGLVLQLAAQGVCTLLLHAPSDGLGRQYAKLVKSGLRVVASAVLPHSTAAAAQAVNGSWINPDKSFPQLSRSSDAVVNPGSGPEKQQPPPDTMEVPADMGTGSQYQPPVEPSFPADSLALLPGGAAFDAAMAVQLDYAIHMLKGSVGRRPLCDGLLAQLLQQRPASELLPALKVLHAMATAVPSALARTGAQGRSAAGMKHPGSVPDPAPAPRLVRRSTLSQVHALLAAHREAPQSRAGLLHASSTTTLTTGALQALGWEHALESKGCSGADGAPDVAMQGEPAWDTRHSSGGASLQVAAPAAQGVLEARSVPLSLWSHAVSLLIQTLRIDGVVAVMSRDAEGSIRIARNVEGSSTVRKGFDLQSSEDDLSTSSDTDSEG